MEEKNRDAKEQKTHRTEGQKTRHSEETKRTHSEGQKVHHSEGTKRTHSEGQKKRRPEGQGASHTKRRSKDGVSSKGNAAHGRQSSVAVHRKRKRRKKHIQASQILLIAAAVVFCISVFSLIRIGLNYKKGTDTYDRIEESVTMESTPQTDDSQAGDNEAEEEVYEPPYVNFDNLIEINQEAQAWILFPDTKINYPVVKRKDNEYYLTHLIDGSTNSAGTLFIDKNNRDDFADKNTVIYGHNMKNGSMFGQLKKYGKEEYYKEHPSFYLYTKDGVWKYDIFSVRVVDEASDSYTRTFASDDEFQSYLNQAVRKSMYDTDVTPVVTDSVVTLSTCTSKETNRLIVQAIRGEQIR